MAKSKAEKQAETQKKQDEKARKKTEESKPSKPDPTDEAQDSNESTDGAGKAKGKFKFKTGTKDSYQATVHINGKEEKIKCVKGQIATNNEGLAEVLRKMYTEI